MIFKNVKIGSIIRNKKTSELWLVVDMRDSGIFITNLFTNFNPMPVLFLFPRDQDSWLIELNDDKLSDNERKLLQAKADIIELYRR